ncbi:MAG TPA: cysteine synthase family protein [Terriglobales bacterium]|nr:cysteine synthase family protein [Terriglobales bacterium]
MPYSENVSLAIGNTALVKLQKIIPSNGAEIFVKLELQNPTGSMKDRMALGLISKAEEDGRLKPGDTLIEYTGGTTGASLAMVCAAKGYKIHVVSSRAFSQEKLDQMVALGAKLTLVPYDGGGITKQLILQMIEEARRLSREPHTYWADQLNNADSIAGYHALGEEIWEQAGGRVDAFIQSVGTAASLRGVATVLKRHNPKVKIIAVEPGESNVLSGGKPGAHDIEGIGIGYKPPLWDDSIVDEVLSVNTEDAKEMARELARKEGIFAGTSSGGNVQAALRVAEKLGPQARIVTLMIDSGLKYVSTDLYRREENESAPA